MQKGTIRKWGKHWQLKYRETVLQNGTPVRKIAYKKLALIEPEHTQDTPPEHIQEKAAAFLAPLNDGTRPPASADDVESFLERFLAKQEGGSGKKLRLSTVGNYQDMFRLVRPHLKGLKMNKTRTPDINRLMRAVAQGNETFAHTTYRNMKSFLSSAFRYAVGEGLIEFNPVRDAITISGNPSDTHAYSLREVKQIEKALKKIPTAKAAVLLATFTGLRLEEIKGLRWADYDGKVLHVQRAVVDGVVTDVKTLYSKAPVPLVGIVRTALEKHLQQNTGDGYIFHGERSSILLNFENYTNRTIRPVLKAVNVEWHGWHAFRRGLSTLLPELGYPDATIKQVMRHSPQDVTGKHYIKPLVRVVRPVLERIEKIYKRLR